MVGQKSVLAEYYTNCASKLYILTMRLTGRPDVGVSSVHYNWSLKLYVITMRLTGRLEVEASSVR